MKIIPCSRREFLKMIFRSGLLAGLGLVMVSILGRRGGNDCPVNLPCRNCSELAGCSRQEAVQARASGTVETREAGNEKE